MLDAEGNPINKRNAWATRSVAYVRLIPPGAADTIHYRLDVPADAGDQITLKAKVNYRKFAWWNTQWSFAGVRDPLHKDVRLGKDHDNGRWVFTGDTSGVSGSVKGIPDLPITTLAQATATLRVVGATDPLPPDTPLVTQAVRERWNDYGIGLLLQGDLKGAEAAFLKVTQAEPGYADGWVNVARARINEGNMEGAEEMLKQALAVNPTLAKTHFFLSQTAKSFGRYDEALTHLREAARQYPRDRVVRNQLGRVLLPEAAVPRGGGRVQGGPRRRSRGSAGALQPDARLPGHGADGCGGARTHAVRALQGRRIVAGDHGRLPASQPG